MVARGRNPRLERSCRSAFALDVGRCHGGPVALHHMRLRGGPVRRRGQLSRACRQRPVRRTVRVPCPRATGRSAVSRPAAGHAASHPQRRLLPDAARHVESCCGRRAQSALRARLQGQHCDGDRPAHPQGHQGDPQRVPEPARRTVVRLEDSVRQRQLCERAGRAAVRVASGALESSLCRAPTTCTSPQMAGRPW